MVQQRREADLSPPFRQVQNLAPPEQKDVQEGWEGMRVEVSAGAFYQDALAG